MEELIFEKGEVATVTVNRPKALNALNRTVVEGLAQVLRDVRHDPSIRVLIVTGAGDRAFVAGADIAAMSAMSTVDGLEFCRLGHRVMATFEDFGFCGKGEVGDYFREGRATYGGDVVVNPHGGLLSEGYLHGLNHHYEAVLQLRHQADARQVARAEVAAVAVGGGPIAGCMLLTR